MISIAGGCSDIEEKRKVSCTGDSLCMVHVRRLGGAGSQQSEVIVPSKNGKFFHLHCEKRLVACDH